MRAPVKTYDICLNEVLGCKTFSKLTEADVDGCDGQAKVLARSNTSADEMWEVVYPHTCRQKYKGILNRERLFNTQDPRAQHSVYGHLGLWAVGGALLFIVSASAVKVRRTWHQTSARRTFFRISKSRDDDCLMSDMDESIP